jgi:hypothetical protein
MNYENCTDFKEPFFAEHKNKVDMKHLKILSLIIIIVGLSFGCSEEDCCVNTEFNPP